MMNVKAIIFSITFPCLLIAHTNSQATNTITLYCPPVDTIQVTPETGLSWASYKYAAYAPVNIPALGNQMELWGEGNSSKVLALQATTWTDGTLVCVYQGNGDTVVMGGKNELTPYVTRCYFKNSTYHGECLSNVPLQCPMFCEIAD